MITLYISYASLGLALLLIVLSSLFGEFKFRRMILTCMFVVTLGAGYVVLTDLLSRPKPIGMFWNAPETEKAYVLGFWLKENEGIYVLLVVPEIGVPRYYKYPWNIKMAEDLWAADREAQKQGLAGFLFLKPFENSLYDGESIIHPEPPPMLEPKPTPNLDVIEIP